MLLRRLWLLQWVMVGLVAVFLCHLTIEDTAANEWQIISQLPTERAGFATAVVEGKIYLFGGTRFEHARGVRRADLPGIWRGPFGMSLVEVYDPETNTWQRLADMPTVRSGARAAVVDRKIYVLTGYVGKDNNGANRKHLKAVEMYDPKTDTWVRKQDIPTPRIQLGIGVVASKIYAIGGFVHPRDQKPGPPWRINLVEAYDPITDTWTKRAKMPTRRDSVKAAVVRDTIYAIGGSGWPQVGAGPFLGTIEVYEPRINRWTKRTDMPNPRVGFKTVVIADKIYLIGGSGVQARGERLTSIEVYDPINEKWRMISAAPTVRRPFSVVAVKGKIYVFGGDTEDGELSPDVEVFDTGFRAVTAKDKLPTHWGALKMKRQNQP